MLDWAAALPTVAARTPARTPARTQEVSVVPFAAAPLSVGDLLAEDLAVAFATTATSGAVNAAAALAALELRAGVPDHALPLSLSNAQAGTAQRAPCRVRSRPTAARRRASAQFATSTASSSASLRCGAARVRR